MDQGSNEEVVKAINALNSQIQNLMDLIRGVVVKVEKRDRERAAQPRRRTRRGDLNKLHCLAAGLLN